MAYDWTGDESKWSEAQKIASLEPNFRAKIQRVLSTLKSQGYAPIVYFGWRSPETQAQLKAAGKSTVSFSFHNATKNGQPAAVAVDIVDGRKDSQGRTILWGSSLSSWSNSAERKQMAEEFFKALGVAGKAQGLVWGGDWTSFKDPAHLQAYPNSMLSEVKRQSQAAVSTVSRAAAVVGEDSSRALPLLREAVQQMPWWGWAALGGLGVLGIVLRGRR